MSMSPRKVRAGAGWMIPGIARFRKEGGVNANAPWFPRGRSQIPGGDLLSPAKDYHRPRMLNGRVRDGNGWGHPGILTEKALLYTRRVSGRGCSSPGPLAWA